MKFRGAAAATVHCKRAIKMGFSLFFRTFNSSKCKTMAKMAVARVKLLSNKRQIVVRQMRRDIAMLLQSGQAATARVRVEHVIREQNVMVANEFIELFCELIVARLPIIAKQRDCPADLKEGISSLIFAAPRCSDIPELLGIRDIFEKKFGKDFVSAATDLRPNSGVNRTLIEKLSVRTPSGEVKLKVMKEIAKEYQVEWDTKESEMELLKPPEELIDGPNTFVSASSLPVKKSVAKQSLEPNNQTLGYSDNGQINFIHFKDTASAAEAAADSAKKAIAAAEAAAYLANRDSNNSLNSSTVAPDTKFDQSDCDEPFEMEKPTNAIKLQPGQNYKRHSYNVATGNSDIKFDESDCDEGIEMDEPTYGSNLPPNRTAPQAPSLKQDIVPRVHPKLPDYETLSARFEALKYSKSQK